MSYLIRSFFAIGARRRQARDACHHEWHAKADASDNKILAATGDNTNVIVLITALVCSAALIILLREKKLMIKAFQNRQ